MAANILKKSLPRVVRDLTPEPFRTLGAAGAEVVDSVPMVAAKARVVFLMVDTTAQVEETIFICHYAARTSAAQTRT